MILVEVGDIANADDAAMKQATQSCSTARGPLLAVELGEAIAKLDEATAQMAQSVSSTHDATITAACLIDLGAARLAKHQEEKAVIAFRQALAVVPHTEPDPDRHAPSVIAKFQRVARELALEKRASLTLVGEPKGASVLLDGALLGKIPLLATDIVPGEHRLLVSADGYRAECSDGGRGAGRTAHCRRCRWPRASLSELSGD